MLDKAARQEAIGIIDGLIERRIDLDEFENNVMDIDSDDSVVQTLQSQLLDDCLIESADLSKDEIAHLNRLLLLLQSDAEIVQLRTPAQWGMQQLLALACIAGILMLAIRLGWGPQVATPIWLSYFDISILCIFDSTKDDRHSLYWPFQDFRSLLSVRRRTPTFAKRKFCPSSEVDVDVAPRVENKHLDEPKTHSERLKLKLAELETYSVLGLVVVVLFVLSPFFLIAMALPVRQERTRVVIANGLSSPARPDGC